jgi:thiamine monophosphate synthase
VSPVEAPACVAAGAAGVACIRAVIGAGDPGRAVCEFFAGFSGGRTTGHRRT